MVECMASGVELIGDAYKKTSCKFRLERISCCTREMEEII